MYPALFLSLFLSLSLFYQNDNFVAIVAITGKKSLEELPKMDHLAMREFHSIMIHKQSGFEIDVAKKQDFDHHHHHHRAL